MKRLALSALVTTLALFAIIQPAVATDLTVTCTAPTQNTDGSPLTDLASYRLYGGLTGATKTKLDEKTVAQGCTFLRPNVAVGTQEYYVTSVNSAGMESPPSSMVSLVVKPPDQDGDGIPDASDQCPTVKGVAPTGCPLVPNPPSNVTVMQLVAYEMRGSTATNDLRMVSVGYVTEGTQCLPTSATIGNVKYQQVPKGAVDLYNALTKLPPVMWAKCG